MQVTLKLSKDIVKVVDLDLAWELFYLYQKGVQIAKEDITTERKANWAIVETNLQNAEEGSIIDFSLMGNIYFENGKAGFNDDAN